MIGAFSIAAVPLFSGFVSKTMIIAAAGHDARPVAMLLLTVASAGTFLSIGLKLAYFMFFGKDAGLQVKEAPFNMLLAMGAAAALCIGIGVYPEPFFALLPYPVHFEPYAMSHVTGELALLSFTALGFFALLKRLTPEASKNVDMDWFYRKGAKGFMWLARRPIAAVDDFVCEIYSTGFLEPAKRSASYCSRFDLGVIDGLVNFAGWFTRFTAWLSHKFDIYIVDGIINSMATLVSFNSAIWRRIQTGFLQNYALIFVLGIIAVIVRALMR